MDDLDDGANGVVSDLEIICIFDIESSLDTSSNDSQRQPEVVEDRVKEVQDLTCPGEPTVCSGSGQCSSGRCICNTGTVVPCSIENNLFEFDHYLNVNVDRFSQLFVRPIFKTMPYVSLTETSTSHLLRCYTTLENWKFNII